MSQRYAESIITRFVVIPSVRNCRLRDRSLIRGRHVAHIYPPYSVPLHHYVVQSVLCGRWVHSGKQLVSRICLRMSSLLAETTFLKTGFTLLLLRWSWRVWVEGGAIYGTSIESDNEKPNMKLRLVTIIL